MSVYPIYEYDTDYQENSKKAEELSRDGSAHLGGVILFGTPDAPRAEALMNRMRTEIPERLEQSERQYKTQLHKAIYEDYESYFDLDSWKAETTVVICANPALALGVLPWMLRKMRLCDMCSTRAWMNTEELKMDRLIASSFSSINSSSSSSQGIVLYSIFNSSVFIHINIHRDMTFLFRFELVVILGIHTYLNMGARPWIYVVQIYNRLIGSPER